MLFSLTHRLSFPSASVRSARSPAHAAASQTSAHLWLSAAVVLSLLLISANQVTVPGSLSVLCALLISYDFPHPSHGIPSPITPTVGQNCLSVYLFHSNLSPNLSRDVNRLLSQGCKDNRETSNSLKDACIILKSESVKLLLIKMLQI